ncbi:MAG: hypothetical protein CVU79_10130 [Elusimicrobia bacterium HGW-Elusimicrobia-3]|jgi:hypothetical protein|nr:MAG: hypothetical protein CVU79_10130 [Elusimicrobia bacterium HGW-Elusimicrobia-3]
MPRLWLAALPAALLFAASFYYMLPLAAPEGLKAGAALALRETFLAAGFELVSDSLGPGAGRAGVIAHLVVRKPA